MHFVHVEKGHESAFHHDTDAAVHHGSYHGVSMVHGHPHRTYGFHDRGDAAAFADKVRGKGFRAVHEALEDEDRYETFDSVDEACAWAVDAAAMSGEAYVTLCGNEDLMVMPAAWLGSQLSAAHESVVEIAEPGARPTDEAHIRRRSFSTRLAANRKRSTSTMDHKRRKIAQTAKLWRMKNKSRVKGYQSVYDRPKKHMGEAVQRIRALLAVQGVQALKEARNRAELDTEFARLKRSKGWVSEGWDRSRILTEIDPNFVHHAEHYDRLLHGGETFPGGGGLRWGGMVIDEHEALLRVMGSFEYKPDQTIYQQTIRFANYRRVAEDKELSWPDKARLLLTRDNLKVHCDCDAYRYWHQRAATVKGFALVPEDRAAPENNPANRGGVCKHLDLALKYIGGQAMRMASEMKTHHEGGPRG